MACISVAIPTLVDARDEILLPTLEGPIENTAASHPWNGAMWQKVPLHLSDYDYVEEEYYVSGNAHVYDWVPGSNFELVVLDASSGKWLPYEQKGQIEPTAYTSRIMIRRPQDMQKFSGRVVVEIINMTAGYDWTAIWGALWEQILKQGDVYVGLTSKPNVFPGMVRFDAARYGPLSMPNPLPAAAQICGTLPGEPDYDPNLSRLTENGLAWDMFSGLGALLKSERVGNPLGQAAKRLYLTGESQSGFYLARYFRWFHQRANLGNGDPVYDGYLAETGGTDTAEIEGLHQCANELNPLPADDLQRAIPGRGVPYFVVHSQWDFPLSKWPPYDWPASVRRPNANTALDKFMLWELAGASHGWTWQYDYSDAAREDVTAAGFETYDFSCGVNQPEIKLYMVEKAAYVLLHRWVTTDAAPPAADYIATDIPEHPQDPLRDVYGNAIGGLRMPEIAVPVAAYTGAYAPDPDCRNVVLPFDADTLKTLYPAPGDYLEKFTAVTGDLVTDGFLLPADAARLIEAAGSRRIH
ncbi:MAG: alpha/beta hydrolase domain-containing protein [Proteobacteria bacterium]|nr:alpha/beta hydrolase domain-containing protein [Pseudomonadota bacterium]MDA0993045.1 alpha/beta hydrolase domain-containing protein [Pseudomonadota bacterium]